jgi:hypothetical protein
MDWSTISHKDNDKLEQYSSPSSISEIFGKKGVKIIVRSSEKSRKVSSLSFRGQKDMFKK